MSLDPHMTTGVSHTVCQIGGHVYRLAETTPADEAAVARLFSRCFEGNPSPGWYAWKYEALHGQALGLWSEDGTLVAHYAGFPRTLLWKGDAVPAIQIGDVMVAPELRGVLKRKGPFYEVCSRFFDSRVGEGKRFRLAFGFPNERAIRLGVALDLYHDAGVIHQVSWPSRQGRLPLGWRWTPMAPGKDLERQVERAWLSMSRDFSGYVLGVRDADFMRRRFLNRPDREYRIFCLRRWPLGNVAAVAVMHIEAGRAELLDVVGPRSVFAVVVRAAAAEAAQAGASSLTAWASPAVLDALQATEIQVAGLAAHLAVAKASALPSEAVATAPWWWMGGDTDFL